MTQGPDRASAWRRVNDVFHRALDVNADERTAFVQRECHDDASVAAEVLSLLQAHVRRDDRLDVTSSGVRARPPDASVLVGRQIGAYQIDRVLGEGGMGVVYQAVDVKLGRVVTLKAIAPAVTGHPGRRDRLRREARAAAALNHPGIATVFALEEIDDQIFIVGEYVAGETLRKEIERGPGDPAVVLDTAISLARALAAAHDRGIVHRDLKPENIIRMSSGQTKILDFGLARMRDAPSDLQNLTDDVSVLGTPAYMSPEQIRRADVDGRSDLFALGIVLTELLTGAHPFMAGDSAATLARILESEPAITTDGSSSGQRTLLRSGLLGVVRTMLRKDPAARFTSAHEALATLERIRLGEFPRESGKPAMAESARRWWRFHQIAATAVHAILLIPIWFARQALGNRDGLPLFLLAVVAVVGSSTIRMHLLFAAESLPAEWTRQHSRSWPWLRVADLLLVAALVASGIAILAGNSVLAVVLIASSVGVLIGATIIEPATTRAAFDTEGE